ncbi:heterokaryon incompatibility protein-domain-containing protein [Chaetomium tenue]|uniref:Heterokaryon incompatibility protein-domain-containing protein n=1 Tax=Chaetomium tenue TaxID=1854479 RepID=A0ACB7P9F6_9PEZI|nr:heterokaryon incompatibility protein-domain-containing protein [Chaetomium globosum]
MALGAGYAAPEVININTKKKMYSHPSDIGGIRRSYNDAINDATRDSVSPKPWHATSHLIPSLNATNIIASSTIMTTPNDQTYPYLPLDPSTHEIRLLTLSYPPEPPPPPSPSTNPPNPSPSPPTYTLTLTHATLTPTPPTFTALSYVWGSPPTPPTTTTTTTTTTPPPHLTISTHRLPVTANLHSALTRLTRQRWAGHLWVDALCINQRDTAEKNTQVPLMSRIYGAAAQVLVWLGPEHDGAALHAVRELGVLWREQVMQQPGGVGDAGRVEAFVRTEVVLARKAVVMCGEDPEAGVTSVAWEDVSECMRLLEWMVLYPSTEPQYRRLYTLLGDIYPNVSHLALASDGYKRSLEEAKGSGGSDPLGQAPDAAGMPLLDTIIWTSFGTSDDGAIQATDPRDRIYGLLGMVREKDRIRIPVDYSPAMTINKVLFSVAKALLEDHGPDILCFCQRVSRTQPQHTKDALPSWVPDWTAPRMMPQIGGVSFGAESEAAARGDASGGARWQDWAPKSRVKDVVYELPVVSLPGLIVGRVARVGRVFKAAPGSSDYLDECRRWLLEIDQMVIESPDFSSNAGLDKETWRVPIADMGLAKRADAEGPVRFIHGFNVLTGRVSPPPALLSERAKSDWIMSESWDYRRAWKIYNRRALIDDTGRPGLGPEETAVADEIAVLAGAHVPFILRGEPGQMRANTPPRYQLVGPTYIFGLADGEGVTGGKVFTELKLN